MSYRKNSERQGAMAKKAAAKPQKLKARPVKERVVDAALSIAATMPWEMISLSDIADEADATLAELSDYFDDKSDILVAYGRRIDRQVLDSVGTASPDENSRDRLFEILMERFDVIGEDREAFVSILKSFKVDPKQAVISLPHLGRSMSWTLEAAGMDTTGIKGAIRVAGLTGIYINVLRTWIEDDSADLSKTMAALDRNLGRAEQAANTFML